MSEFLNNLDIQRILIKELDRNSGLPVAGIVYPADLADALKTGVHVMIINETVGTNTIVLCTAMRQIFLSRFNHDFHRLVQEGLNLGRMTDVRGGILVVPGKQDEKKQQQFTRSQSKIHVSFQRRKMTRRGKKIKKETKEDHLPC